MTTSSQDLTFKYSTQFQSVILTSAPANRLRINVRLKRLLLNILSATYEITTYTEFHNNYLVYRLT